MVDSAALLYEVETAVEGTTSSSSKPDHPNGNEGALSVVDERTAAALEGSSTQ
jgi:hypothetical protein